MKNVRVYSLMLIGLVAFLTPPTLAQTDNDEFDAPSRLVPAEFQDSGFQNYVDLGLVGPAITKRDASLLTDIGLQLAEGERTLLRTHQSGITANTLLTKAAKLASDEQDKATLQRLAKAAEKLGDKDLATQLATLEKIGGTSRETNPAFTVSVGAVKLDTILRIKDLLHTIKEAEFTGNIELLEVIESKLTDKLDIPDAQKDALLKLVKAVRESNAANRSGENPAFQKLTSTSRPVLNENMRQMLREFILRFLIEALNKQGGGGNQGGGDGGGSQGGGVTPPDDDAASDVSGSADGDDPGLGLTSAQTRMVRRYYANSAPASSIAGQWRSRFGTVNLDQSRNRVTGTVDYYQGGVLDLNGNYVGGMLKLRFRHRSKPAIRGNAAFLFDNGQLLGTSTNSSSGRTTEWRLTR